jgi:hypothetical protein
MGASSAAKPGDARGRNRTRRRREHLLPLLPLPPRRRAAATFGFLPADEPCHRTSLTPALRLVATKVRMATSLPLWTPRPSSRGENKPSLCAAAPPLVMPAFMPGWAYSFAGVAAFVDAHSLSGLATPCRRCTSCRAARFRDAVPCRSRSRSRSRA